MDKEQENKNEIEEKKFLKIVNIRPFSNANKLKLKEEDIILCVDGKKFNSSYEELVKLLENDESKKILTVLRGEVTFNFFTKSSLGIKCELIPEEDISILKDINFDTIFDENKTYYQYEIFRNFFRKGVLLNLSPSILPSIAPPLWMIYHRIWMLLAFTLTFYLILFYVSPWLFFVSWLLKSWYYGNNQIDVLRNYYKFVDYRLFISICAENEEEAQKKARELDSKIDFDFSYLEPPIKDEDPINT